MCSQEPLTLRISLNRLHWFHIRMLRKMNRMSARGMVEQ